MSIGFIGCGNMATAIIDGIIAGGAVNQEEIFLYDVFVPAMQKLINKYERIGICDSEEEVVRKSDAVVLAVKPNVLGGVLNKINSALDESDTLLISIAAGKTIEFIRSSLSHDNRIIRVMPNINAMVNEAMCAYCCNNKATSEDKVLTEKIFNSVGQVMFLEENYFPLFGVVAGCSPAFVYMFIDSLARAAVKNGMKKDVALKICAQAVLGSAKMILEADEHPYDLIDKVCSPGGTTIEAVTSLQKDGFNSAIHDAVDKALEKDRLL